MKTRVACGAIIALTITIGSVDMKRGVGVTAAYRRRSSRFVANLRFFRDAIYGTDFSAMIQDMGMEEVILRGDPVPRQN